MSTKFSVELLLLLALIPLPGPSLFRIPPCCRDNSRIVRKIVQSKLLPVLDKFNVKLGLECPFHPARDLFAPQQTIKQQDRPSQWTCSLCGKSFYEEKFLDLHFENRHAERINTAEDAVCLSNYCDIMRCDVLAAFEGTLFGSRTTSTDIEVWNERTAIAASNINGKRSDSEPTTTNSNGNPPPAGEDVVGTRRSPSTTDGRTRNSKGNVSSATCDRRKSRRKLDEGEDQDEDDAEEDSDTSCEQEDVVEQVKVTAKSPLDRKQQRLIEMQRLKANCKKEDLEKLRAKCQILIRDCIGGLLVNLSTQQFKDMEDELNRKICWYLTCDRYWEDGVPDRRAFPWLLLTVAATILSGGICLCYYIIWVLFDSDDYKFFMINSSSNQALAQGQVINHQEHPSPTHSRSYVSLHHPQQQQNMLNNIMMSETPISISSHYNPTECLEMSEVVAAGGGVSGVGAAAGAPAQGQSEHYIYVTYPPELKRKLLESCYNRTTRL